MVNFVFLVIVELLLNQNVKLDLVTEYGDTALHGAVFGNKPEIMQMLIQAGECSQHHNMMANKNRGKDLRSDWVIYV